MKKYIMVDCSKQHLEECGFSYNREFSSKDDEYYSIMIPLYKWHDYITLRAEIRVCLNTNDVSIDVYDGNTNIRTRYAPYYYMDCGDFSPLLGKINKVINNKKKEFGIVEVDDE